MCIEVVTTPTAIKPVVERLQASIISMLAALTALLAIEKALYVAVGDVEANDSVGTLKIAAIALDA